MAENFIAILESIAASPLGTLLYPVYLLAVFLTTYYLALVP